MEAKKTNLIIYRQSYLYQCKNARGLPAAGERYTFHTSVLQGLVGSLYASGDGTTPEKAIVVKNLQKKQPGSIISEYHVR